MHINPRQHSLRLVLRLVLGGMLLLGPVGSVSMAPVIHSATISVNTTDDELNDDGDCSLREAIMAANTDSIVSGCSAGGATDIIIVPEGIYTLSIPGTQEDRNSTGDLDITADMTIDGDGPFSTVIQAGPEETRGIDRVFDVLGATVTFKKIMIRHGRPQGGAVPAVDDVGGGISSRAVNGSSRIYILESIVEVNSAPEANGGGVFIGRPLLGPTPSLTVRGSMISSNTAGQGGGGVLCAGCDLEIADSTIADNHARVSGGLGMGGGGIYVSGHAASATLVATTITGNLTAGDGGGIYNDDGTVNVTRSRIVGNSAAGSGDGIRNEDLLGSGVVRATDNWWGCDGFPGDVGCDDTSGPVDSDPRLDLLLSPASPSIPQNGSTELEAEIASSSGHPQAETALNGLTVTFGASGLAGVSVANGSDVIIGGLAADVLSCGSTIGSAKASVTLDNGTQYAAVTCVTAPTPTPTAEALVSYLPLLIRR